MAAEAATSAAIDVAKEVGTTVCSYLYSKIAITFKFQRNVNSLREKMSELTASKKIIEEDLESADRQGKVATQPVKDWLEKVNSIEGQVNSMEKDIIASIQYLCGCCPNCYLLYKLSKSIMEKIQEVNRLIDSAKFPEGLIVPNPRPKPIEQIPGPSVVDQIAASTLLDHLKNLVMDDRIRKIGVYGMGGVGKTTLVSNLNNMMGTSSSAQPFGIVIWVTVSSVLNLQRIQSQIADRLKLKEMLEKENKERWAIILLEGLKKQRKFLLILDDVWEKIDLDKVGIPQGEDLKDCKIILTTRSLNVCNQMETDANIKVEALSKEAAWKLFSKHVGELHDIEEIQSLARDVAQECKGLPLAIKVVGSSMRGKKRVELWRDALKGLRRSAPSIEHVEEEVFLPLKWSYDSLQGKNIQPCFLYCSLFPEDSSIEEDDLVQYWRAEGLIDESMNLEESLDNGVALIEKLKDSCMLEPQNFERTVKMHDIFSDVALWIACSSKDGNKFFFQSNKGLSKITEEGLDNSLKRVSLASGELREIPNYLARCSWLSTLFLQENPLKKIPKELFLGLKQLRVLDLSRTLINYLPKEVGELKNLRLLNLSWTLRLKSIEDGATSGLSSLEILDMHGSGYEWKQIGEVEEGNATLDELVRLKCLYYLRIRINSHAYLPLAVAWLKRLRRFVIRIGDCRSMSATYDLILGLNERVVEVGGDVEHLAKCAEGVLSIATHLTLMDGIINGISELAKNIQMQSLISLTISRCEVRKPMIRREDVQHCMLPNLEILKLQDIENVDNIWEELVPNGGGIICPKLRRIDTSNCGRNFIPEAIRQQLQEILIIPKALPPIYL
ncbi:disease resistance protein At4g27190-like [Tasmannia lanceolata]|uniref:disease resistance protein At4g27190-like n=1 Tax=Tasmannia lanceolata TaxID=3420 RepID=UPI004063BAF4